MAIETKLYNFVCSNEYGSTNVWAVMTPDQKNDIVLRVATLNQPDVLVVTETSDSDEFDAHGYPNYEWLCDHFDLPL